MGFKCDTIVTNPIKTIGSKYTFNCILTQSKNMHLELSFQLSNKSVYNRKNELLNKVSIDNTVRLTNQYANYGDFVPTDLIAISTNNLAVLGKRQQNLPTVINDEIETGQPNTYIFLYNRTSSNPEIDEKLSDYKLELLSGINRTYTSNEHKKMIDYRQFLINDYNFMKSSVDTQLITGGIPIKNRVINSPKSSLVFYVGNNGGHEQNYQLTSSFAFYPLSFYHQTDSQAIKIEKNTFVMNFNLTAMNHYYSTNVEIKLEDDLFVVMSILQTVVAMIFLIVICLVIYYYKKNKKKHSSELRDNKVFGDNDGFDDVLSIESDDEYYTDSAKNY